MYVACFEPGLQGVRMCMCMTCGVTADLAALPFFQLSTALSVCGPAASPEMSACVGVGGATLAAHTHVGRASIHGS